MSLMGLSITGCKSAGMPSWFSKDPLASNQSLTENSFATSLSNTGKGITNQFKTMGSAVSSAVGKAKDAVTAPFVQQNTDESDPLSLNNMPGDLGPEIWVANGQLYEAQGNFVKALDNYTKALEADPRSEVALLSTARLYSRQEQFEQAAEFYKKAIANNAAADTYCELAVARHKQGKVVEAQDAIQKAIEMDPRSQRYRNNYANMLVVNGRSDEAAQQLQFVMKPEDAYYNIALMHFNNKNSAGAQQYLQLALSADPKFEPARRLLQEVSASGSAQTALAAYQTADQIMRTAQAVSGNVAPNASLPNSMTAQANSSNFVTAGYSQPTSSSISTQYGNTANPTGGYTNGFSASGYPGTPQYPSYPVNPTNTTNSANTNAGYTNSPSYPSTSYPSTTYPSYGVPVSN